MAVAKVTLNGTTLIDISGTTAEESQILPNYGAYGADGVWMDGSVTTKAAATYSPSTSTQTIAAGQYLTGAQTIEGDENLVAENIASGVSIFGVAGTHSGGASNFVTGTFTTYPTSGSQYISIPYTGSGYPIACIVYVTGGVYNSDVSGWYTSTQRYAVGQWAMSKAVQTSTPTYSTSGTENQGVVAIIYKNSTSNSTTYSRTSAMNANTFSSKGATESATLAVRFFSSTLLSVYIAGTSYGLLANTEYTYHIIYSS